MYDDILGPLFKDKEVEEVEKRLKKAKKVQIAPKAARSGLTPTGASIGKAKKSKQLTQPIAKRVKPQPQPQPIDDDDVCPDCGAVWDDCDCEESEDICEEEEENDVWDVGGSHSTSSNSLT